MSDKNSCSAVKSSFGHRKADAIAETSSHNSGGGCLKLLILKV